MTCARYVEPDAAERYVLGQMTEAEQSAFEEHYFACDDCFEAVRALQDLQTVLRTPRALASEDEVTAPQVPSSTQRPTAASRTPIPIELGRRKAKLSPTIWWTFAAAASLLIGFAVWQRQSTSPETPAVIAKNEPSPTTEQPPAPAPSNPSTPSTTTPDSGSRTPSQASPSSTPSTTTPEPTTPRRGPLDYAVLALVAAPSYVPMQTRGAEPTPQADAFQAAMAQYAAKDYAAAAAALEPIAEANPADGRTQFFLGISNLMTGDAAAATAALDRAVASNAAPFATEAHFYLAKAALRDRDAARAERELKLAVEHEAGPAGEAERLLRTLQSASAGRN